MSNQFFLTFELSEEELGILRFSHSNCGKNIKPSWAESVVLDWRVEERKKQEGSMTIAGCARAEPASRPNVEA